jgi:hypothetical protein
MLKGASCEWIRGQVRGCWRSPSSRRCWSRPAARLRNVEAVKDIYRGARNPRTDIDNIPSLEATVPNDSLILELARTTSVRQIVSGSQYVRGPEQKLFQIEQKNYRRFFPSPPTPPTPPPVPAPKPFLEKLELDTGYITFSGGVPVGGSSHLSLFPNGAFSFSGHFHVSGAPSYDVSLVWLLKSSTGTVFRLARGGRLHGFFEAGSRDFDWGDTGTNPALAGAWSDISAGYSWRWDSAVNIDLGALADEAIKRIGQVATVIALI